MVKSSVGLRIKTDDQDDRTFLTASNDNRFTGMVLSFFWAFGAEILQHPAKCSAFVVVFVGKGNTINIVQNFAWLTRLRSIQLEFISITEIQNTIILYNAELEV